VSASIFDEKNKPQYKLQVADYDGANAISIAQSKEPIMSPAWSPDGQQIAYVSFEHKVSEIFIQTLKTGEQLKSHWHHHNQRPVIYIAAYFSRRICWLHGQYAC
jgi:TolB protein